MSEHDFHVHGPHDHEVEHATQHEARDSFTGRIALTTALLATLGALFAYEGGAAQANAGMDKNNAAIKKTEASNQWNYYQAKSSRQYLSELGIDLAPASKHEYYTQAIERYKAEKAEIKKAAEAFEAESKEWDKQSDEQMHLHHRWAQATTALQISIALAAIALLTRRRWLQWGVYGLSAFGIALGAMAFAHM
jgi:hypothetical protein